MDTMKAAVALEGTWQHSANVLIDRVLPPICTRPTSPLEFPLMLLSNSACFRASLSLALGFGIVLFAGLIKLPQIATIVSNKSVAGLALTTFLIETFGYSYNLAAHYRQRYPISTYGDFFVLIAQNYIILYLFFRYNKNPSRGIAVIAAYAAGLALMCSPYFPLSVLELMTLGNVMVVVFGRTPQIYTNYVNKSTGALSMFTCWGIFLGALARIFTTLQDVDSLNILVGYLTSACFNGTIAFQTVYYNYIVKPPKKDDKVKKAE
ncbi:Mannose-P-dolichol utilization defect 1 protein [Gracilariopsis chorda]|uniref:Mannose-P-dolichol utilization defect 1 protein homolog n=1 Tax=Gracilariopsis chorda TaxID=448386 RepID=A0A2V3IYV5_9FLOR|nr:Mannose-P-dolichol utilization defect 1 protein [Gracilariopsis chorda]|eukprot:PXF47324.1 Mannose-P-dolichol utilization defect 1 protein [Gracilariopsis chorda]